VQAKIKQVALIVCLFLFLFVVIGGGLHLSPGGAFLAAATGTPLLIRFFNRRCFPQEFERDSLRASRSQGFARNVIESDASHCRASETETALRQ
jgi:hypothetical protein